MATEGGPQPKSSWQRWTSFGSDRGQDAAGPSVDAPSPTGPGASDIARVDPGPDAGLDVTHASPSRAPGPPISHARKVVPEPEEEAEEEPAIEPDAGGTAADDLDDEVPAATATEADAPMRRWADELDGYDDLDGFDDLLDEPIGLRPDDSDDDGDIGGEAVPLLPAMVARIDVVHGGVTSLAMRLDALASATGMLRTSLGDRVDDYAATVTRLSINSAHDLDEYRRSTERALGELRRSSLATDEALDQLGARADEVTSDVASLTDIVRSLVEDVRAAGRAAREQAAHRDAVDDSPPPWAAGLVDVTTLRAANERSAANAASLRAEISALRAELAADGPAPVDPGLEQLRAEIVQLRAELASDASTADDTSDAIDALRAEIIQLRTEVAGLAGPVADDAGIDVAADLLAEVAALRATIDEMRASVDEASEEARTNRAERRADPTDPGVAAEVAELRRDTAVLPEVRDLLAAVVDGLPDSQDDSAGLGRLVEQLGADVARLREQLAASNAIDLEVLADMIASRFEVVESDPAPAPAPPPPPAPAAPAAPAASKPRRGKRPPVDPFAEG